MVTKIVTANDVDNVTIVINGENKLQVKLQDIIEEIPRVTPATQVVRIDGIGYSIGKVGKIKGTDWLLFQLKDYPKVNKLVGKSFTAELLAGGRVTTSGGYIQDASNVILQLGGDYREIINVSPYIQLYLGDSNSGITKTSRGSLVYNIMPKAINELGQVNISSFIASSGESLIDNRYAIRVQAPNNPFGMIYQSNELVWHTATSV